MSSTGDSAQYPDARWRQNPDEWAAVLQPYRSTDVVEMTSSKASNSSSLQQYLHSIATERVNWSVSSPANNTFTCAANTFDTNTCSANQGTFHVRSLRDLSSKQHSRNVFSHHSPSTTHEDHLGMMESNRLELERMLISDTGSTGNAGSTGCHSDYALNCNNNSNATRHSETAINSTRSPGDPGSSDETIGKRPGPAMALAERSDVVGTRVLNARRPSYTEKRLRVRPTLFANDRYQPNCLVPAAILDEFYNGTRSLARPAASRVNKLAMIRSSVGCDCGFCRRSSRFPVGQVDSLVRSNNSIRPLVVRDLQLRSEKKTDGVEDEDGEISSGTRRTRGELGNQSKNASQSSETLTPGLKHITLKLVESIIGNLKACTVADGVSAFPDDKEENLDFTVQSQNRKSKEWKGKETEAKISKRKGKLVQEPRSMRTSTTASNTTQEPHSNEDKPFLPKVDKLCREISLHIHQCFEQLYVERNSNRRFDVDDQASDLRNYGKDEFDDDDDDDDDDEDDEDDEASQVSTSSSVPRIKAILEPIVTAKNKVSAEVDDQRGTGSESDKFKKLVAGIVEDLYSETRGQLVEMLEIKAKKNINDEGKDLNEALSEDLFRQMMPEIEKRIFSSLRENHDNDHTMVQAQTQTDPDPTFELPFSSLTSTPTGGATRRSKPASLNGETCSRSRPATTIKGQRNSLRPTSTKNTKTHKRSDRNEQNMKCDLSGENDSQSETLSEVTDYNDQ